MSRPAFSSSLEPGAVIAARYRLGAVLGRGGMAVVHDGYDLRLERPVAVKLLRPEMAARPDIHTRFEVEARAAAGLSHPNAVAVFDIGEHDGVPFIVMERLPGETLADRIAAGPVDPGWLTEASLGVLDALAEAHDAGIVHRDVKPGNILLTASGTAKISDFGIAKSTGVEHADLTTTGQLLGTPAYLAPERIDGAPATARSDLWALGVVLYEALAGSKPFAGSGPIDVARAVVAGAHRPLGEARPGLDPGLVAVIERAMAPDPDDRFPGARAMASALRNEVAGPAPAAVVDEDATIGDGTLVLPAGAAGATVAADRPAAVPLRQRALRRRADRERWMALALVAVLLVLVVGVLARAGKGGSGPAQAEAGQTAADASGTTRVPTTKPSTTVAPSPSQSLARKMRDVAGRLDPARDGSQAGELAARLKRVADQLDAGSVAAAAGDAVDLATAAAAWNQAGQLSDSAFVATVELLSQVPGVQIVSGHQAPSAPAAGDKGSDDGKGKGKGKGGKD